jgi:SAM-dependent methyltransferase
MTGPPRGSGPGVITPDGCAVDFYALLPAMGEPELVHAAIPAGASILELGAGAGRMTHPLVALGHPVVAVDESPEMLAHIHGGETVNARIQALDLGRRFDAVLLASFMVNTADEALRQGFLRACRRHVRNHGRCSSSATRRPGSRGPPRARPPRRGSPSASATWSGPVRGCCRRPPSTGSAAGCGPSRSPPGGWTTPSSPMSWPTWGWRSTPT